MQWLQVTIDAAEGEADLVAARLEDLGIRELIIEDESDFYGFLQENRQYWDYVDQGLQAAMAGKSRVIFYLEDNPAGSVRLDAVKAVLPWPLTTQTIQEEDWAENWKQYFKPLPIGRRLLVLPRWESEVDPGDKIPLFLDPGLLFGTGAHPTTKRCLELVENLARPGQRVLDLGCGSGILSIAALRLGAARAIACDIDPKAPAILRANAALNGLDDKRITPLCGDVLAAGPLRRKLGELQYDLILANIVADVIVGLSAFLAPWLHEDGRLICSGILDGRENEVESALISGGFAVIGRYQDGDWHSFVCGLCRRQSGGYTGV